MIREIKKGSSWDNSWDNSRDKEINKGKYKSKYNGWYNVWTILPLIWGLYMVLGLNTSTWDIYDLKTWTAWKGWNGEGIITLSIGIDNLSVIFVWLVLILTPLCIISNWYTKIYKEKGYNILIGIICTSLAISFISWDLFTFYIGYELTFIPLYIILWVYGSSNRQYAGYLLLIFTFMSSLFLLLGLTLMNIYYNSTNSIELSHMNTAIDMQNILFIILFMSIWIKAPLFPFHIWLPVVHSENPLAGSMILAGIILKLTVYIAYRWILPVYSEATIIWTPMIYVIALITILYISYITMTQLDLKVIIAYSSIAHMAVLFLGLFANNIFGLNGALSLSISHGLVSPALFFCVGGILYERYHTRILYYYYGLANNLPVFTLMFVLFSFANIGTPLSLNFLAEFLCLLGSFMISPIMVFIATFSVLLSAVYQFRVTSKLVSGGNSPYLKNPVDLYYHEGIVLLILLIFTILLFFYPYNI